MAHPPVVSKGRSSVALAMVAAVVLLVPVLARADGLVNRVSVAVHAGTQVELAGDAVAGVRGTLLGRLANTEPRSYRDLYRPDLRLEAVLGYGVSRHVELTVRASRYAPRARSVEAGRLDERSLRICVEPDRGGTDTTCSQPRGTEHGLELGLRFTISPQSRLEAYVGVAGGLRHARERLVTLDVPEAGAAVLHVPFSQGGWVAAWGADLGIVLDVTPRLFLGLDTGVRYEQPRRGFSALPELGSFDERTGRWTAPVAAAIGLRF